VWAVLVVVGDEGVEECLQLVEAGWGWSCGEPAFEGLVEAFDLAAGGRMVPQMNERSDSAPVTPTMDERVDAP
jgi:hypothetical protein